MDDVLGWLMGTDMTTQKPTDAQHIDVAYVARLARLSLTEAEIATYGQQLEQVLEYVDQILQVDVGSADSTSHQTTLRNVFREDQPAAESVATSDVAANAPCWRQDTFLVPRIIE